MFNLSKKERGAVAVFLIIVLVPMITCAALFVEVSRVKLSQSLVTSAGDLALNTVLSRYDFELNEYFGMLASAQTENDVISATEDYFKACLKSQDIDTSYLSKYVNSISGMFKNGSDVVDFLDLSVSSFSVTPTANGALNNPALIKTQIVDFMKYRSPINLASDLLSAFTDIGEQVNTLPDQTECLDKQQTFYDTEEELLETAYNAYEKMTAYLNLNINDQYVRNMLARMDGYKNTYELIHRKLVFDLVGTENLSKFTASTVSYNKTSSTYSSSKKADFGRVKDQINSVANAMSKYLSAKKALNNVRTAFNYNSSTTYGTRYYINVVKEFNKNNQYTGFVSKANDLATKIANLKNAYENYTPAEGEESKTYKLSVYSGVNTSGEKTLDAHYSSLISQWDSIVTNDFKSSSSAYNFFRTKLPSLYATATKGGSLPSSVTATPDGGISRSTADSHVTTIYTEINEYYTKIKDGVKHVDDAIGKLNKLKKLVGTYKSDFNNWKTAANKSSLDKNDLAKQSRKDINDRELNPEIINNITESGVQALIDRLNNIKSVLGEIKSVIEGMKYNGKKVVDIKNLSDFEKASGVKTKDISIKTKEINTYANSTFSFESKQSTLNITQNNHPDLNTNPPGLYSWMKKYFVENASDNEKGYSKSQANDTYDKFKDKKDDMGGDEASESTGLSNNEIKDIANRPSGSDKVSVDKAEKSGDMTKLSNFVSDLFGNFSQTLSNAGTALRDNLYTLDYIMSMLSYDTFENERRLELWVEKNPTTKITATTDFKTSTAEQWKNTDATFKANKSLTNQMINDANCYSYGNEVEYILYGGSNTANKAAAYGTIFMLRLALDAGPVFGNFFNDHLVITIANSVSAATLGVVPAPLVQFAICLALTITEATMDISHIKKGIGVPLLKTDQQLFVSFDSDDISTSEGATGNETGLDLTKGYLQYSDYITLFLFIALLNSEKADAIYLRTADVIQANMTKRTGNSGYRMSQAQVYFTLSSDIKVSPLILPVPLIDNNLGDIKSSDGYKNFSTSKWNTFSYSITRGY